jgi:hypothetical protein
MGLKAMMLPESYFPLILYFSRYSIIKTIAHQKKLLENIILYKTIYFSLFPLPFSLLIDVSCNETKSQSQFYFFTKQSTKQIQEQEKKEKKTMTKTYFFKLLIIS